MQPLHGVKVLDFSTLVPGPLATLILAEAGAEVTKVERPGTGDGMREYGPYDYVFSVPFAQLTRGKEHLILDLKSEEGRQTALDLAADADVVVEQFRPGVMDRLGLGFTHVRAVNADVVYCSITGYGQTGQRRDKAGHDLNYIAETGLLWLSPGSRGNRVVPPALIADIAGGAYPAVLNILLALRQRDLTGEGFHLDIAMADNVFPLAFWAIGIRGSVVGGGRDVFTGGSPRYRLYDASDGGIVAVAALEQQFWDRFVEVIGLEPELRDDSARGGETAGRIAEIIGALSSSHWRKVFAEVDCCCSVVRSIDEALADPAFKARGLFDNQIQGELDLLTAAPVPLAPIFRRPANIDSGPLYHPDWD